MNASTEALRFSLNHINKFYDSDFFPKLSEFSAINTRWSDVEKYLIGLDLGKYKPFIAATRAAPKNDGGFRIVHQLDPLDTILYTSFAFEIAESIEKCRPDISEGVACSYRFQLDTTGTFFDENNGYLTYVGRSRELSGIYSHVLMCDITAFYNHIYVHRLQNIIEGCDPKLARMSKVVENFLIGLNNGASSGIPVGPAASIIMSETILLDVDNFLAQHGVEFVRYADDIRIFSNNRNKLVLVLAELSEFLYNVHRLSLSSSKSRLVTSEEFIAEIIELPDNVEKQALHQKLAEFNLRVNLGSSYDFPEPIENLESLPNDDKVKIQAEVLSETIQRISEMPRLDLGLARHIIRRCKYLRSRAIYKTLLEKFDFFAPVVRDVILYLDAVSNKKSIEHNRAMFELIVTSSVYRDSPYVRDWLGYLFSKDQSFQVSPTIREYLRTCSFRYRILTMKNHYGLSWLRSQKSEFDRLTLPDKRALLSAYTILPKDEKSAWVNSLAPTSDYLESLLRSHVLSKA